MKKALVAGITEQDGSYIGEFLPNMGYDVDEFIRRVRSFKAGGDHRIYQTPHDQNPRVRLVFGDFNDPSLLNRILRSVQPDEIPPRGG